MQYYLFYMKIQLYLEKCAMILIFVMKYLHLRLIEYKIIIV